MFVVPGIRAIAPRGRKVLQKACPKRRPKKTSPHGAGAAFWLQRADGAVLLRRRPEKGLLGGMMEVPSSPWEESGAMDGRGVLGHAPAKAKWQRQDGIVRHTFTHFHLELVGLYRAYHPRQQS